MGDDGSQCVSKSQATAAKQSLTHMGLKIIYIFRGCSGSDFCVRKFRFIDDILGIILGLIWLQKIISKNSLSYRNYKIITLKNLHSSTCA